MKNLKISLRDKAVHFIANHKCYSILIIAVMFLFSFTPSNAQYISSTSTQSMYPTTGTSALNLDKRDTKYLSNFSFPGTGVLTGETIQLAGWSTDNNGGFSYGRALSTFPYTYTGDGALAIPDARDVQVGFMVLGGNSYIVAAYYDVTIQLYAYDLYTYTFTPPSTVSVSKLYTYHFRDPDHVMPGYIPCTSYSPSVPPSSMGVYSIPVLTSTMGYNRISMDVNKDGNKVVMVMTNNDNGYLYLAAGGIGADTIIFSPNLPDPGSGFPVAIGGAFPEQPILPSTYPGLAPWAIYATYAELYDVPTGYNVRYYFSGPYANEYHYSYYPLDQDAYVTVTDAAGDVIRRSGSVASIYNPLIGIKGCSYVTSPGNINEYFNYYWPDVCFSGDDVRLVVYINNPLTGIHPFFDQANGAEDLYITPALFDFFEYYNYTGQSTYGPPSSGFKYAGPNHMEVAFVNSYDGRPLRQSPTTTFQPPLGTAAWSMRDFESLCNSLPLVPGEDIRAKIDAPDAGGGTCAITFAYSGVPALGYDAFYPASKALGGTGGTYEPNLTEAVHNIVEAGKKNIYVRYQDFGSQAILTNGSIATGHTAINTLNNIEPAVSFSPTSINEIAVAWVSEDAGVSTPWSYIGVQLDISATYGGTGYLLSAGDYLRIPNNPTLANDCGDHPLVSLSKHDYGLANLYTCFTQEDATPTYSVQHQDHIWSSPSTWRIADPNPFVKLQVGPNPFSNTLHISSSEAVSVSLMDITGKQLMNYSGSADIVNRQLDNRVIGLAPGNYLLNATTISGHKEVFKVTKQ